MNIRTILIFAPLLTTQASEEIAEGNCMLQKSLIEEKRSSLLVPAPNTHESWRNEHRLSFVDTTVSMDALYQSHIVAKVLYVVGNGVVLGLIATIYYDRGLQTVIAIMALVVSLSLMSNTIKEIYLHHFEYPQFITACHQLATCSTALTILMVRRGAIGKKITTPSVATVITGLGPVAICFAVSLGCSNLALLYTNTHFYEMLTPMNPLFTFGLGVALGQNKSMKLLPPVLLVTVAMPLVAFGEFKFSMYGFAFAMSGVLFRAAKAQAQSMLMSAGVMSQTFDPVELACWTTTLTFVIMVIWSSVEEGLSPYKAIHDVGVITAVLLSCANAVVLNMSVLFVMKEIGPVAQQILGELKGALACLGAVAAFGEVITIQQIVGYAFAAIGVYWYNHTDTVVRAEEMDKRQAENIDKTRCERFRLCPPIEKFNIATPGASEERSEGASDSSSLCDETASEAAVAQTLSNFDHKIQADDASSARSEDSESTPKRLS